MTLLATLRPPTRDEASRAYRDRIAPSPDALGEIARSAGGDRWIDVEVDPGEVRVLSKSTDDQKDTEAAAVGVLQALQLATGWYVFGLLEDGFEPEGQCDACSIERFAWQDDGDACPACGDAAASAPVPAASREAKPNDTAAEALVDALLENEWVELVTAASRKALVRAVADFLVRHPHCREPVGAAPLPSQPEDAAEEPEFAAPSPRELAAMSPGARAAALADVAGRLPQAIARRAKLAALAAAAPKGNPGFDLLDYLTDLPYVAEVYADEDALAALLRGSAAPDA